MDIPLIIMLVLVGGILTLSAVLIIRAVARLSRNEGEHPFESFYFREDELVINTLVGGPAYRIADVERVEFICQRNRGNHNGRYQIWKQDGKKSQWFMFDGSVHTQRTQWVSSKEDILKSTEILQKQLEAKGIPSTRVK